VIYASLDTGEQFPLANISGGINKVVSIMLALTARRNSVLCIDEIEDGIYFKHQPHVWNGLASIARRQEAQLFLTTHNEEWLEAVFDSQDVSDIALWRLERTKGGPVLRQFGGKQASIAVRGSGEVR
jgi:AAA15 family ATPase/GTPase